MKAQMDGLTNFGSKTHTGTVLDTLKEEEGEAKYVENPQAENLNLDNFDFDRFWNLDNFARTGLRTSLHPTVVWIEAFSSIPTQYYFFSFQYR